MARLFDSEFMRQHCQDAVKQPEPTPSEPDPGVPPPPVLHPCRYLALDPALSTGWSMLQVDEGGTLRSVHVGILEASGPRSKPNLTDGSRCNDLRRQVRSLLTPSPSHAYIESYHVHPFKDKDGRWKVKQEGIGLNYKLRAALEMEPDEREIPYTYVVSGTWKKHLTHQSGAHGSASLSHADKQEIQAELEKKLGCEFPSEVWVRDRWLKFRPDASDATGIALCGSRVQKIDPLLTIVALGRGAARRGNRSGLPALTVPIAYAESLTEAPQCNVVVSSMGETC